MFIPYLGTIPQAIMMAMGLLQTILNPDYSLSNSTEACNDISRLYPSNIISKRNTIAYYTEIHRYYSQSNSDLLPTCIVYPNTTEQVAGVVSILNTYPDVPFAVKSGGHNFNVGFSNVQDGVLIALSSLSSVRPSEDQRSVDIGPGARWGDVQSILTKIKRTVVSGRMSDVAAGGLILGGGLSFLSTQYGFACDGVLNFELVLPNATIINANSSDHSDLFFALKGGGNQFGIVTKFTMETHPIGLVWGGYRIYRLSDTSSLMDALQEFTADYRDPRSSIILTFESAFQGFLNCAIVFFFYDGPRPSDGAFGLFEGITPLFDNTKTQPYPDLLKQNNRIGNSPGVRVLGRITSLPSLQGQKGKELLRKHQDSWREFSQEKCPRHLGIFFATAYQPIPRLTLEASRSRGENALGLDPESGDQIWVDYFVLWSFASDGAAAHEYSRNISDALDDYVKTEYKGIPRTNQSPGYIEGDIQPIRFMNAAMYDQDVFQSYGNRSFHRLKAIQESIDPNGAFTRRIQGWKFNK